MHKSVFLGTAGTQESCPQQVAEPHLHPLLLQVNAVCQVLAGDHVWVLVLVEKRLQRLQLLLGEYGAVPARAALDLLEGLHLTWLLLGTPTDPDCWVEELQGPGEASICKGTETAVLEVWGSNTCHAQGSSGTRCIPATDWKEAASHLEWVAS